jgi:hypothetical protein
MRGTTFAPLVGLASLACAGPGLATLEPQPPSSASPQPASTHSVQDQPALVQSYQQALTPSQGPSPAASNTSRDAKAASDEIEFARREPPPGAFGFLFGSSAVDAKEKAESGASCYEREKALTVQLKFCPSRLCAIFALQLVGGSGDDQTYFNEITARVRSTYGPPSYVKSSTNVGWVWASDYAISAGLDVVPERPGVRAVSLMYVQPAWKQWSKVEQSPF